VAKQDVKPLKDDLRTGRPLWLQTPNISVAANRDIVRDKYDVVVVGAGISGALVAQRLSREGYKILVLDRRAPVRGSTPASTAMIQHEIDVPLIRLRKTMGETSADDAWKRSVRAVKDLVRLTRELKIDCSMQPKKALYLAGDVLGARALKNEAEVRGEIGIRAEWLDRAALQEYGIDRTGAILSFDSASANPAQLTAGLLNDASRRGAVICAPIEVTDVAELSSGVAVATSSGAVVAASHAVFCTGYEFLPQMRSDHHKITSTWAVATKPIASRPQWMDDLIVWEASDPYLYFRTDSAGRIIAGGEDEEATNANDNPDKLVKKAAAIVKKLESLTGLAVGKPAYVWAAPFGTTKDGLPIIDRMRNSERVFAVMGFGGNGITFSMIASQIIAAEIRGRSDPDAHLFALR
jgi:glycine/D-amino acid oxidase-like deaminating enzyme